MVRGQVLAELADWDVRAKLAQAQAKYQATLLQVNRALAANNGTEAGVQLQTLKMIGLLNLFEVFQEQEKAVAAFK